VAVKRKAKRKVQRKAKRTTVTIKRKVKRRTVKGSEIILKRGKSLSKAHDAEVERLAEWRASAYKALAERWAAPDVADSKPKRPMRAFGQPWWSLPVATAWVATRDRNFVDQVLDKSMRHLAVALAKYAVDNKSVKSASLPYKNSNDAFIALRNATAEGGIQAVGDPYRWSPERPPREVCEPRRAIDPLEIVSAVCRDDHGIPDCIMPELKRPHGSRFQNVYFLRKHVLARFPALQATLATARNESEAAQALSSYVTSRTTRADAKTWLGGRGFNIGPRVFQRVWRKARESAGLTPMAPRGRKRRR
jgi:hypothetical protein